MVVSSTSMKVAIETTKAMRYGLCPPAAERSGDQPLAGAPSLLLLISLWSNHFGPRHDRHARSDRQVGGPLIDHDLHRNALHDLDEIAGCVFRRQQAEGGAGARLHRCYAASQRP